MFDNLLKLFDGSETITDLTPTSTTRANGSVVIDLGKTPASGLSVVTMIPAQGSMADTDALQLMLQESDSEASGYEGLVRLVAGEHPDLIYGSEVPCVLVHRFITTKRYLRVQSVVHTGTAPTTVYIFLVPNAYGVL